MHSAPTKILLEPSELASLIADKTSAHKLRIVNANYAVQRPTYAAYNPPVKADHIFKQERIPTARFIDISEIGDKSEGLPCMLPQADRFKELMMKLDIGNNDYVVVYGDDNVIGACRVYWMFKTFGFEHVSILNGPINVWKDAGFEVETGEETWKQAVEERQPEEFEFKYQAKLKTTMADLQKIIVREKIDSDIQLIDTRKTAVFRGDNKDPKGGRTGHLPGFKNVPFVDLLREDGGFKSSREIEAVLQVKELDTEKPTIVSCNSGMTATVAYFGMSILGAASLSLYDGSWTEWVKYEENPVVQGE